MRALATPAPCSTDPLESRIDGASSGTGGEVGVGASGRRLGATLGVVVEDTGGVRLRRLLVALEVGAGVPLSPLLVVLIRVGVTVGVALEETKLGIAVGVGVPWLDITLGQALIALGELGTGSTRERVVGVVEVGGLQNLEFDASVVYVRTFVAAALSPVSPPASEEF